MSKKEILIPFLIILIIFSIGFVLRIGSTDLSYLPADEQAFIQDSNGIPYMHELDSYYNYRLTKNYIDHGYLGDTLINSTNWDLHSFYPPGRSAQYPPLIIYITAFFYKLVNIFSNIPLIVVCFWLPAFIGPLAGVIAYLFVRRFSNDYGGAAAGILAVTIPFYFIRTVPGWFDTDMFNVIFPLLIMWFIAEAAYTDKPKNRLFFTILASLSTFIFSMAWEGWVYVFYIVLLSAAAYTIFALIKKLEIKNILQILAVFITLTTFLVVISDFSSIGKFILPFKILEPTLNSWPDISTSISEMRKPSLDEIFPALGYAFLAGILSLVWIFRVMINKKFKNLYLPRITWFFYLFIVLWTIIGFISTMSSLRYLMIIIPPIIVSSGIMVGICVGYFAKFKGIKRFKITKSDNFIKFLSIFVVFLVAIPGIINDYKSFEICTPEGNDDLWNAAVWINNNTSNDTVIISEWSYGYLYTGAAPNRVSVDGGSQNSPRTFWIYKAFSTDNESLSLGIFKMIATTGDMGYLVMNNYTKNTIKTVEILNNILGVDKNKARHILTNNYGFSSHDAEIILNYTHPNNPRPFVLVTNDDLMKKGFGIFNYGLWDFNTMKGKDLTYTFGKMDINNGIANSSEGVLFNLKTSNVTWDGKTPYYVMIKQNGKINNYYVNQSSDFSVFLLMDSNFSVVIDKGFENTLFTKLVIERSNSTHFKSIYENKNVVVWKPDFENNT